ncbi:MAG: HlyD family efflux transporter periplasmic adaptor subunit [Gammaproteobacteria bacterium]
MNRALLAMFIGAALVLAGCAENGPGPMVGTLERDRVEITVESDEPILSIEAADGERVVAGQVLLRQDPARANAALDQRIAERDQAAARLAELRRGPREERVRESRAQLEAAQALTENARLELDRQQVIFDRGLGEEAALDGARSRWRNARAEQQAAREALEELLNGTTVEELQQAEAALAAAEARVGQARLDLDRLTLRAPVNGVVDKVWWEVGERPPRGATVALVLDDARAFARIYVPEPLRADVQPGATLQVALDGHDRVLEGTVAWVSADASFTPYFALTEHDRARLSFLAEVDLPGAADLPSGLPLEALPPDATDRRR